MKTQKVEFEIEGVKHSIELKRLSFGEKNAYQEEATNITLIGNQQSVKVSTAKLKEIGILKSVVNSTIPIKGIQDVQNLPSEVGEKLFEVFTELNQVDLKQQPS